MRRRMALAMVLLVLIIFPAGTGLIVTRCFDLTMERERARALSEEAAIARAVAMEIGGERGETLFSAAAGLQKRYGSPSLSVMLIYNGQAMAGAQIADAPGMDALLAEEGRATLLDGENKTLYIAHRLGDAVTLLIASDVSPVYALRNTLAGWAALLCTAGVALSVFAAILLSGMLMRPVLSLSRAAKAIQGGAYDTPLPKAGRDEIGDLTRAFSAMAQGVAQREDALRDQTRQRQELIDAMAHEMRTPLTAIVAGSSLLRHANLPEEDRHALLETMEREAKRLSDMDERLLLLTRLAHEAPVFAPFSSLDMAREALSAFDHVTLRGEDSAFTGERELTILLMRNLVVNAQRAGGKSPVAVTLSADGFSVRDDGCGMTKEQIARAFEPFYRADKSRSRAAGGAGLGLALCLRIAQLHGGTLDIQSEPGRGTCVFYRFDTTA